MRVPHFRAVIIVAHALLATQAHADAAVPGTRLARPIVASRTAAGPDTPTCSITVSPTDLTEGGPVVVAWRSANSTGGRLNYGIGAVPPSGSRSVTASLENLVFAGVFSGPHGSVTCSAEAGIAAVPAVVSGAHPPAAPPQSIVVLGGSGFTPRNVIRVVGNGVNMAKRHPTAAGR
jgi:hypothetical protein